MKIPNVYPLINCSSQVSVNVPKLVAPFDPAVDYYETHDLYKWSIYNVTNPNIAELPGLMNRREYQFWQRARGVQGL